MRSPEPQKNFVPGFRAEIPTYSSVYAFSKRQRGVVLILTLIVLVAMTLAAIALVRSVDTGNVVAGNMAFKQGVTHSGDAGTEAAIAFLRATVPATGNGFAVDDAANWDSLPGVGYYASVPNTDTDMTGSSHDTARPLVDWGYNNCNNASVAGCYEPVQKMATGVGNNVSYIIQRLCSGQGAINAATNNCVSYSSQSGQSPSRGSIDYAHNRRFAITPVAYYHITSRITGPRNTVSYVDTVVHF
jgi:type IV pilus assembly protein PilX